MLLDQLMHTPVIDYRKRDKDGALILTHQFEGKQLVEEQIPNVLIGLRYLWGNEILLGTTRLVRESPDEEPKKIRCRYKIDKKGVIKRTEVKQTR